MTELLLMIGRGLSGAAGSVRDDPGGDDEADDSSVESGERASGLTFGTLGPRTVAVVKDAPRRADGATFAEVTQAVRTARSLGAETLIVVDWARALDPNRIPGEIVVIRDHMNLLGDNPLAGPNDESLGPRFPDMTEAYDGGLRQLAFEAARSLDLPLGEGVLAAIPGPNLETPAERRMLRTVGADLVGNGVVPEVIVANYLGMRVLGFAVVTAAPVREAGGPRSVAGAGRAVQTASRRMGDLLEVVAARL